MSVSVASTDIAGVNNAVQRLQELGTRMKADEFGFKENDVLNIDRIIESILELEAERNKVHELLETETIKSSVLRHKLLFLPAEVKDEITGCIESARNSNTSEIQSLQKTLDSIISNTQSLATRHAQLEQENSVLHPQRDEVRQSHEEIIALLNQRMAEKATKQIILNETRDKLRGTNQHIVDLEEGIVHLREDLIQERADARLEKKRLKKAVDDTTKKTLDQKVINVEKKKELDVLHEKLMESEADLDTIRKTIRRFDTSRAKLEGTERALDAQLKREVKHNQELRKKGDVVDTDIISLTASYNDRSSELESNISELDAILAKGQTKNEVLEGNRMKLEYEVKGAEEIMYTDAARVAEMTKILVDCTTPTKPTNSTSTRRDATSNDSSNPSEGISAHNEIRRKRLREAKDKQAKKAEDIARMNEQISEMTEQLESLAESHEAVVNQMNKQIEECRDLLGRERKDRMEVQQRKEEVERNVESFKSDNSKYMAEVNRKITEGKKRHDELTKEGHFLQKAIREDDVKIKELKITLKEVSDRLGVSESSMLLALGDLERNIEEMKTEYDEKAALIKEKTPDFLEMEKNFDERTREYDQFKKDVVALKNKRMGLDESVKRTMQAIEKVKRPQDELQEQLKSHRKISMGRLKEQTMLVSNIEKEIFEAGIKLKAAINENNKFRKAIQRFENDLLTMKSDMLFNLELHDQLEENHGTLRGELNEGWDEDSKLEAEVSERDENYIQELAALLQRTMKREGRIDEVTGRLYEELALLTDFLENVAKRRPIETRDGRRSRLSPGKLDTRKQDGSRTPGDSFALPSSSQKTRSPRRSILSTASESVATPRKRASRVPETALHAPGEVIDHFPVPEVEMVESPGPGDDGT